MSDAGERERYACDRCHRRKLGCSRKIPICDHCHAANQRCVYSRTGPIARSNKQKQGPTSNTTADALSVEERITKVERSITALTSAVEKLTASLEHRDSSTSNKGSANGTPSNETSPAPVLCFEPISILGTQGSARVSQIIDGINLPRPAINAVSDLGATFGELTFDDEKSKRLAAARRSKESFFIPKQEAGARFLEIFLETIERFSPHFQRPPTSIQQQIVFEPTAVKDRGWLLLFYGILSTHFELEKSNDDVLIQQLEWNTWLAMDEANLFLEPSIVKIQAFLLLSIYAQGYSTPNLCWALIGHACRMMQAIGLPGNRASRRDTDYEQKYRHLLFWTVYTADRGLAISLGQPPNLVESLCEKIPLPTEKQLDELDKYNYEFWGNRSPSFRAYARSFGATFFIQWIKLAKIHGKLFETAYGGPRYHSPMNIDESEAPYPSNAFFKRELDNWFNDATNELTRGAQSSELQSDANAKREAEIGMAFIKFQYYHMSVVLTRDVPSTKDQCIESARMMLSLLKSFVSGSEQLFNGTVWYLLYCPFTHFFIVFGHIISDPQDAKCSSDLALLRETVSFFSQMIDNHRLAAKLEKVASIFSRLADDYVSRATKTELHNGHGRLETGANSDPTFKTSPPLTEPPTTWSSNGAGIDPTAQTGAEPSSLLADFYAYHYSQGSSPSSWTTNSHNAPHRQDASNYHVAGDVQMHTDTDSIMQSLGNRAFKKPLDFNVDWLSQERLADAQVLSYMEWS